MFKGEYSHTIDAKGRLIMPSKYRELLGEPFIQLLNLDMMTISMDNHDEVQLLKSAINAANYNCYVSLRYHIQWDEISAIGGANILFESFIPNRKELLQFILAKFFEMKNYLKEEMLKQQYSEQPAMLIN